jgi:pimeloyl-ACP methyl ester carboxylesterase
MPPLSTSSTLLIKKTRLFSTRRQFTDNEIEQGQKPVELQYRVRKATNATNKPPLIILHGLLGHSNNWSNIAAKPELYSDRDILCVDLRNHGSSPHTNYTDYIAMANDVAHLIQNYTNGKSATVIGHSMGGKVTATLALLHPHLVTGLGLIDILPINYPEKSMEEIQGILSTVAGCDFSNNIGRKEIDMQLSKNISSIGIRQWLLTNITSLPEPDSNGATLRWKPNVHGLLDNYERIRGFTLEQSHLWPYHGPSILILGGLSGFGDRSTALNIMHENFPECQLKVIENAGHWCHSEKPNEFADILTDFLKTNNL